MPPHAVQSSAMPSAPRPRRGPPAHRLAHEVVARAVVGLAGVAEAPRHRREDHHGLDVDVARGGHQVEQTVGLHAEDQVELLDRLAIERTAALQAGGVQDHVELAALLADVLDHGLDRAAVEHVDLAVEGAAAGLLDRAQGFQNAGLPFEIEELLLDLGRRGAALLRLQALEHLALGRLAILAPPSRAAAARSRAASAARRADRRSRARPPPGRARWPP